MGGGKAMEDRGFMELGFDGLIDMEATKAEQD